MFKWVEKFYYYSDFCLLLRIFLLSIRISLSPNHSLIPLANPRPRKRKLEREKVTRYINLCLYLRKFLGFKDTCFTSSLLLCHFLRRSGINAQVNFAAKKANINKGMTGHCWVSIDEDKDGEDWRVIFKYPSDKTGTVRNVVTR